MVTLQSSEHIHSQVQLQSLTYSLEGAGEEVSFSSHQKLSHVPQPI